MELEREVPMLKRLKATGILALVLSAGMAIAQPAVANAADWHDRDDHHDPYRDRDGRRDRDWHRDRDGRRDGDHRAYDRGHYFNYAPAPNYYYSPPPSYAYP